MTGRVRQRRRADQRGMATLEMVLLLPCLMLLLLLGMQAAMYSYAAALASGAAQDGARAASAVEAGASLDTGRAAAAAALEQSHGGLQHHQIRTAASANGATVTVTGECLALIPGVTLHVERSATLPWEELS